MSLVVTHIAGKPVRIGTLCRQLCAWCGTPLESKDLRHISYLGGAAVPTPAAGFSHFPEGAYVETERGRASVVGAFGEVEPPRGFCGESDLAAALAEDAEGVA